jgi:hypothetical protein
MLIATREAEIVWEGPQDGGTGTVSSGSGVARLSAPTTAIEATGLIVRVS